MNHLQNIEPVIQDNVKLLIEGIGKHNGAPVNVVGYFRMFALDVVGEYLPLTVANCRGIELWTVF